MLCFEVSVNGATPVRAGLADSAVLNAILTFVGDRNDLSLRVGGLVGDAARGHEYAQWLDTELRVGDAVLIRIVETDEPSPPLSRRSMGPAESEDERRRLYEELRLEHGDDG